MALNTLLSYAYHADTDLERYRRSKACGRIMVDSGAFTAHSGGRRISLDAYAEFLETWRGTWDHAITLDVIGDPAATAKNTRILHARGLPVMPVFTRGGDLAEFDAMVDEHGYVCVGALTAIQRNQAVQAARVKMLQRRAVERGGGIHALGVASMNVMRAARPFSTDASTFEQVPKYGAIVWFDGQQLQQATVRDRKKLIAHRDAIRAHGLDLAAWMRAGRYPVGADAIEMITCMAGAYAAVDEHLTDRFHVEPPAWVEDSAGTHVYVAVGGSKGYMSALVECDRRCHSAEAPSIWRQHGAAHDCAAHTIPTRREADAS